MPNSEGAMGEVDWNDDEASVRAALNSGGSCWAGYRDNPQVFRIWSRALPGTTDPASVLLGTGGSPWEAWKSARSHHWVQAYELAHNPAKRPQPSERSTPFSEDERNFRMSKMNTLESMQRSTPGERQEESPRDLCGAVHPRESRISCDKGPNHHGYHASSKDEVRVWADPQPSPVDEHEQRAKDNPWSWGPIAKPVDDPLLARLEAGEFGQIEMKPVDDLGELERLADILEDDSRMGRISDDWNLRQYRVESRPSVIQSLLRRVREAEAERFNPLGDNHHNALKCPHCNSGYREMESRAIAAEADWQATEQALQSERQKSAGLEEEIARLRQEKRDV